MQWPGSLANIPDIEPTAPTVSTSSSGAKSPEMGAEVANRKMAAAAVHAAHSHEIRTLPW